MGHREHKAPLMHLEHYKLIIIHKSLMFTRRYISYVLQALVNKIQNILGYVKWLSGSF